MAPRSIIPVFFVFLNISLYSQDSARGYIVKIGDIAPDFEMTLTNGEVVRLSRLKGKVVMLQFTASWCGVCRREMPYIEKEIWQKLKNEDNFALYGVDLDEPPEKVKRFAKEVGITYQLGLDPEGKIFSLYAKKGAGVTRNVIIDKSGRIVYLTRLFDIEEFTEMKNVIFSEVQ